MRWLCRAQGAAGGGGVSRSYSLRFHPSLQKKGWIGAYPETTGYIIPTFFEFAVLSGESDYSRRAIRMAEWETDVQMKDGAVQGGTVDSPPSAAVFNTGQVLFGWTRAYQVTGNPRFLKSAQKAADFLAMAQDPDGAWRRFGSRFARKGVNLYDARTAWGLLEAAAVTADERHRQTAIRNLDYVVSRQHPNGWFPDCCLDDNSKPLLHTIAYTTEGLLGAARMLGNDKYLAAAVLAARPLLERQLPNGSLPGRFDDHWRPRASWSCLTGDAQTALAWLQIYQATGERAFLHAARRINRFLMSTQDLHAKDEGIRGGIKGSYPIWAEYGPFEFLNWAAKFFADSLMLETKLVDQTA